METEIGETNDECDFSVNRKLEIALDELAEDSFNEKLTKLNESSELNLVFIPCLSPQKMGARKEKYGSGLYHLYKQVTKRGGFYRVMKDEKWDEIESALNLGSSASMLPAQLQKVYEVHLLPFEHAYWRMTNESNPCSDTGFPGPSRFKVAHSCTTKKRKQSESSSHLPCSGSYIGPEEDSKISVDTTEKRKQSESSSHLPRSGSSISPEEESNIGVDTTEKRKQSESSSHQPGSGFSISPEEESNIGVDTCNVDKVRKTVGLNKKKKRSLNSIGREVTEEIDAPPMNPRTGHHIFLRLECHRLKLIHGENSANQNIRKMVLDAWTSLSDAGKQPYIDASKIDRERYEREMEEYNKRRGKNENATTDCSRDDNNP